MRARAVALVCLARLVGAYKGRRKAFNQALRRYVMDNITASQRSFVTVGTHLFHRDDNDPLSRLMRELPWSAVLLIEASPWVASQLRKEVAAANPFAQVPLNRVFISNSVPDLVRESRAAVGRGGRAWTTRQLRASLVEEAVPCRALPDELSRWPQLPAPAVVLMDVEGLDCRIVESHDFCVPSLAPQLLVYEWHHCTTRAQAAARARLDRCPGFKSPAFQDRENIYFTTAWLDSPKTA